MLHSTIPTPSKARQLGVFSVLTAFTLLTLLLFLVLVLDSGRLYMQQRQLQKVADMAALEAISRLPLGNCSAAPDDADLYAKENARDRHKFLQEADNDTAQQNLTTACVRVETGADNLRQAHVDEAGPAVQVTANHTVPSSLVLRLSSLFSDTADTIELQAVAVAERETPTASFSVGAQLLRLDNDRLVGQLLKGVGLNPQHLTVLDSDGLANAQITPAGLLKALGVEIGIHELKALSPQGILELKKTNISLLRLIEVIELSADVVSDSVLAADLDLLHQGILHNPILQDINLQLFGTETEPGLLRLASSPDGTVGAALDTAVNLGDLLGAGLLIGVHDANRALTLDASILGAATVELGIVEPPSIGIGPVGTKAYNAQVRLYVGVDTNNLLGGILAWLTDSILGIRVKLPIWIDVVTGEGTLEDIHCDAGVPVADIRVETDILNACIGRMPDDAKWSTSGSCEAALEDELLIKLLHTPVLNSKIHIPALGHEDELRNMSIGETRSTSPNALALGNTVTDLVNALLELLGGLFKPVTDDQMGKLADPYIKEIGNKTSDVNTLVDLALNGKKDAQGSEILPPLFDSDWPISNGLPVERKCNELTRKCTITAWADGTFSSVLKAYSNPGSIWNLGETPSGYEFCGEVGTKICIKKNFVKLMKDNANHLNNGGWIQEGEDGKELRCVGLCRLLKPVMQPILNLLNPVLNGLGRLLTAVLADVLGLELGRTDVTVHAISCGTPQLVR